MMDEASKDQLMAQFRAYLDRQPAEEPIPEGANGADEGDRTPDLYSLFTELSALKNEVKLESRQLKTALDHFKSAFDTLETGNASLSRELDEARERTRSVKRQTLSSVLVELLDLRDRLAAGIHAFEGYRAPRLAVGRKRQLHFLRSLRDGQEITLRRLDQLLTAQRVQPLEAVGKPLDPTTMRAAEIEHRADLGDGIVIEELRRGYLLEGELLRVAEVKVNKG